MNLVIFLAVSVALIAGVEFSKRVLSLSPDLTRRMMHVGAALIACIAPFFISMPVFVVVCLLFAFAMLLGRRTALISSVHAVERTTYGDVFLPLGEAIAALLFLPAHIAAFQYGVLVMGISDAAAGFVGDRFGRHPIRFLGIAKTVEGTVAFFIITLLITFFFVPVSGYVIVGMALLLTAAEFFMPYGLDNVLLPILGGFLWLGF